MRLTKLAWCVAVGSGLIGCGGDGTSASGSGSDEGVTSAPGSDTGTSSAESSTGGNSNSATAATTAPPTDDTSDPPADSSGPPPVGFDVASLPDLPPSVCQPGGKGGGGNGDPEFSFLWASNSAEGTISKIDTQTVTEVGRYATRPDALGSPSRTSVSLTGNVAVANRTGGITKFYANQADCVESNGMGGLQTSETNVALPWDQEECRAWYIPFDYDSQRPVAWAPGDWNQAACTWQNEKLWTAGRYGQVQTEVVLIDGDAGVVLDTVDIPGLKADQFGLYGGAVDADGNFWTTGWATGNHLVRVDIDNLEATVWPGPSILADSHWYGMTVDVNGYVWNCASRVARFDPEDESWTVSDEMPQWSAGCMADADPDGLLWLGSDGTGLFGIDRETFDLVHTWPTPSAYGVSIDFFGYVWAVNGNGAHRVDPETGEVTSYNGLTGAYTYSDMTGYALNTVGGGIPSG
jgi:hypothetical protein